MTRTLFLLLASVFTLHSGEVLATKKLFTVLDDISTSGMPACEGSDVVSCQMVEVDFEAFTLEDTLEFPEGKVLSRGEVVETENMEGTYSVDYTSSVSSESAELAYSIDENTNASIAGSIHYGGDLVRTLQNCGDNCHIYIVSNSHDEDDSFNPKEEAEARSGDEAVSPLENGTFIFYGDEERKSLNRQSRRVIHLTLYYTPDYERTVGNARLQIIQQMRELNDGFRISNTNIQFVAHCIRRIPIGESSDSGQRLIDVMRNRGSWSNVLNTADMAVLFTRSTAGRVCGQATSFDALRSFALPLVWFGHRCNQYTFAHELGHLFGARHNVEIDGTREPTHGHLMVGSRYKTIMAYRTTQYNTPINRFSDDTATFGGIRLGNSQWANVHQQIVNTGYKYANLGDQSSGTCSSTGNGPCRDMFSFCPTYATRGECTRILGGIRNGNYSPYTVAFSCPMSCRVCTNTAPTCVNTWSDGACNYYAGRGWCRYLGTSCRKSCRQC